MIYHFKHIENGQIAEGYTVLDINDHEAEVANDDGPAILLAEKNGGELVTQHGKPPKYKASLTGVAEVLEARAVEAKPETRNPKPEGSK